MEIKSNMCNSVNSIIKTRNNWISNINWQAEFYSRISPLKRKDSEFDWAWYEKRQTRGLKTSVKSILQKAYHWLNRQNYSSAFQNWFNIHTAQLWDSRELLEDDLSKLLFDNLLILKSSGCNQFYYPRINFDDFITFAQEQPFVSDSLPLDYLGLPLQIFSIEWPCQREPVKIISTKGALELINNYRQYFIRRNSIEFTPSPEDIVIDCGACIGDISMLFAGLVGAKGKVHAFDPVPLHCRFCEHQASLNPAISHVLLINPMAVGDCSKITSGICRDSAAITPGSLKIDAYSMTTLDDYALKNALSNIHYIKMDIEGAELSALKGAAQVIQTFNPKLAISAYHKPEDLWEIPQFIKAKNRNYKLFFGHHSPITWESVFYAA